MLHIKELQAVLTAQASQTEGRLHTLICSKQEVHMLRVVTAEYDLKPACSDVISTYFSPFSIKIKSLMWMCKCCHYFQKQRTAPLCLAPLPSPFLEFTHSFQTALGTEWSELIYQNDLQCLFSFNVFF